MSSKRGTTGFAIVAASIIALGACTGPNTGVNSHIGDADPYLGEAVKYDSALMIINPDPVYPAGSAMPGDNGDKGAAAVKRYRTDQVNARHKAEVNAARTGALSTTQGTAGNSGGGTPPR